METAIEDEPNKFVRSSFQITSYIRPAEPERKNRIGMILVFLIT